MYLFDYTVFIFLEQGEIKRLEMNPLSLGKPLIFLKEPKLRALIYTTNLNY